MAALSAGLYAGLTTGGLSPAGITLQVEPGRAVYGNAGIHLTRVLHLKHQEHPLPRTWIETDTSEAFLADTIIERNSWTIVLASEPARPARTQAAVTGISCGFDLLVPARALPEMVPARSSPCWTPGRIRTRRRATSMRWPGRPAFSSPAAR